MADIAGNFSPAFEIVLINGHHHLHPLAGYQFRLFVILVAVIFDLAEPAFHRERRADELHGRDRWARRNALEHLQRS
jgi:hypothetical protein